MPKADVRAYNELWMKSGPRGQRSQVHGAYWREGPQHVVAWSLASPDAMGTARHEAVHYLRNAGLITRDEWQTLQHAALQNDWFARYDIPARYPDLSTEAQIEEAVAEAFADWQRDKSGRREWPPAVREIFRRIQLFLQRLARKAKEILGHEATADDIFRMIESGEIGSRTESPITFDDLVPAGGFAQEAAREQRPPYTPPRQSELPFMAPLVPTAEIISDQLANRNFRKLAKVSRALGFGRANTTETRVQLQDKFLRWQKIQDAAQRATGRQIPESLDVYMAESLYYGRTGQQLEKLDEQHIEPIIKEIKKQKLSLEDVDRYLMAKHAPERNAAMAAINPELQDGGSGMTNAEARAVMARIDAEGKRAAYEAVEQKVRSMIDATRETLLRGGLISRQTSDAWRGQYDYYVPLRGWEEGSEDAKIGTGRGYDIRGGEAQPAMGRSSIANSPLGHAMLQAQNAIVRAEKNKVGLTALRFVQQHPQPQMWKIDEGELKRVIDPQTGLVTEVPDPTWIHRPNVFAVKIDGKPHYINFQGPYGYALARALKNMGASEMNAVLRFVSSLTRITARLATSLNPDFMVANFIRDTGEAFVNLPGGQQKEIAKRFKYHLLPALGGAMRALMGRPGGQYAEAFREYDQAGGRIRFLGLENVDDIKSNIAARMRRLESGPVNSVRNAGAKALDAIEIVNGAVENATRLAAFMSAREAGLTPAKAASLARELTVNFNRKGEMGNLISGLYMFANAALQGITRSLGALKTSPRARKFAGAMAAMGAMLAFYNIGAGGDDEDGVPYYQKIPRWERDANFILMWPKGLGRDGQYIKIPMAYGYSMFGVLGARLTSVALQKDKPGEAASAIAKSVLDTFDPLGRDENMIAQFTPTFLRPAVHVYSNESWTGRKINPEVYPNQRHLPDSSRYFRSASPFSIEAAKKLNEWTGGDKRTPGLIDVGPGTVDHAIESITGGLGRFVKNSADTALGAYQGTEWRTEKTPIVRKFIGAKSDAADRVLYYDERDKSEKVFQRFSAYRRDKDGPGMARVMRENPDELAAHKIFAATDKATKPLRDQIDTIKLDAKKSAREKELEIKNLSKLELDHMNRARRQVKALYERNKTARAEGKAIPVEPLPD